MEHENWPKVMEFCDQSWNYTNFVPELYQICTFFATSKNVSIDVESLHFLMISAKCREFKINKRDGHGKSRNGHGKYVVKSVETSKGLCRPVEFKKWPVDFRGGGLHTRGYEYIVQDLY